MIKRVLTVLICVLLTVTCLTGCGSKKNEQITVTSAQLIKVLEDSKLNLATYEYDGVTEKTDKNGKVLYYIFYEGKVKAGLQDIQQITTEMDEDGKTIITIPSVVITEARVVDGSLDFIYENKKYEGAEDYSEAQELAQKDLEAGVEEDKSRLLEAATENAISTVKAITKPLIGDGTFEVVISGGDSDD